MITVQVLIAVLTVLSVFAGATERLVEMVKPLFLKIKDPNWQVSAKVAFSALVGFGIASLFRYDLLTVLGLSVSPVLGYLAAGLVTSAGSSVLHPILDWLKTLVPPSTTNPPV